jgi:hypothetical protein
MAGKSEETPGWQDADGKVSKRQNRLAKYPSNSRISKLKLVGLMP